MDYNLFVSAELNLARSFAEWLIGCVRNKQVYSMNVGCLGDMLVVCAGIFSMQLGCIQAWMYQRTFLCISNIKLNQDSFDLPSILSI